MNCNETLIQIEDLMLDLCTGKYHWQDAYRELKAYQQSAIDIYDSNLQYSPMLQGYFDLMSISKLRHTQQTRMPNKELFHSEAYFEDYSEDLLAEHDRFIFRHQRQRKRNFTALRDSFEDLLSQNCKLLLVRVDFSYSSEANIGIRQFDADLKILRRRIHSRDTCFNDLLDYSWAIEQGRTKGYHCHLLLIYNGSKRMHDGYYGEQVAKVWMGITHDQGCYFNCNRSGHKDNYRRRESLGIGMIHRSNEQEVKNAINAINYLARVDKQDQHLRAKIKGMRCFG